ncbi:MAG: hypothetical protein ACM3TU_02940 [Bacillota bacterium]
MSEHLSFGLHLAETRDHGLTLNQSWFARHHGFGHTKTQIPFRIWLPVFYDNLTVDDVIWCLVAAAMEPTATHVVLHVRQPVFAKPSHDRLCEIAASLAELGFETIEPEGNYDPENPNGLVLTFSLFTRSETLWSQSYLGCGTA